MNRERLSKIVLITALFVIILQITAMVFHYPNIAICYIYEDGLSLSMTRLPLVFGIILGFTLTTDCEITKKMIISIFLLLAFFIISSGLI